MLLDAKNRAFFMVLLCVPLSGVGVDLYAPSLPAISHMFNATEHLTQWTMTTYIVAFGLGQFILGPISDTMGRRSLILIGTVIYLLSVFGILMADSITQFLLLRAVQGLCVATISVPGRAITADVFAGADFAKRTKTMTMAWGAGPIIAPAIGGYLQTWFGWHANFWFMFVYGLLIFVCALFIFDETHHSRPRFHYKRFGEVYRDLFSHDLFLRITLLIGLCYAFVIIFHSKAPFIIEHTLGKTPVDYGYLALLMGAGWFVGNILSRQAARFPVFENTTLWIVFSLLATLVMFILTAIFPENSLCMALPVVFCTLVSGLCLSHFTSIALALFPKHGGAANACYFAGIWVVAGITTGIYSLINMLSTHALSMGYVALSLLLLCVYALLVRPRCSA